MRRTKSMAVALTAVLTISAFGTSLTPANVNAASKLKKIKMAKSTVTVEVGKKVALKAKKKPKNAPGKLKWKSSNKKVAKVNKKGVVTGIKPGTTTITVKVKTKGKTVKAKRKVKVVAPAAVPATPVTPTTPSVPETSGTEKQNVLVSALTAEQTEITVNEGEVAGMDIKIAPSNADNKTLQYSVSDTDVATVSDEGVITAVAQGSCVVTAVTTDGSNKSVSVNVTVTKKQRPRAIVTQDGEVDDMDSLIHMLLYANEIDIQGIIHSSSNAGHWEGVEGAVTPEGAKAPYDQPYRWPGTDWMYEYIDAYAEVYSNLKKHDSSYPTPEYLRSVTKVGNIGYPGEIEKSTDGSELIKKELLEDDDRTLYLMSWGGPNTITRALMDIEAEYKDTPQWNQIKNHIEENTIITGCFEQDDTYKDYIAEHWPGIAYVNAAQMSATAYGWINAPEDENKATYRGDWMYKNLEKGHGALLDKYVTWGDGTYLEGELPENQFGSDDSLMDADTFPSGIYERYDFISEGDSPCWYMLIDNGLRDKGSVEALMNGGYSGRYQKSNKVNSKNEPLNYWSAVNDTYDGSDESQTGKSISSEWKWVASIQNDFAARADWCIADSFDEANHAPKVAVTEGIDISASRGEKVKLHAVTDDPDGDFVTTEWKVYSEASSYEGASDLKLRGASSDIVSFTVPEDAESGSTIHLLVKASDDGEHNLAHYQQVIVTVK
ncbi:MAG TPA: DUF1593 domain-containing protein [Candidatus Anaerobutyricum faecale]|nr:DUF1593 domain-containing protein [Candidatus Anaerobutyricum faecale]